MLKVLVTSIASAFIISAAAIFGVRHYTQASPIGPYEADVDHDGFVTILDLSNVAQYYLQRAPLPTATPPSLGGGAEYSLVNDEVFPSGAATMFGAATLTQCPGRVLYMAVRSLGVAQSLFLTVFGNGYNVNAEPDGDYYVFQGTATDEVSAQPSNGPVAITLEVHCRPTLP